jgi:hypothetical protein
MDQQRRIERALSESMKVVDFQIVPNGRTTIMIFGITSNVYAIELRTDGQITCTCPDASKSKSTFCKHICFVLIRIAKLVPVSQCRRGRLTSVAIAEICESLRRLPGSDSDIWNAQLHSRFVQLVKRTSVSESWADLDDDCPICYTELCQEDSSLCVTCRKPAHNECMNSWFERGGSGCSLCRGPWHPHKAPYIRL